MKKLLAFMLALLPVLAQAQNSEIGLSGGIGLLTPPSGSIYYKADQSSTSSLLNVTFVTNLSTYSESRLTWQVGFDFSAFLGVKHESTQTYSYFTKTIGNDGKFFRYANYLLSVSPILNAKYKLSDVTYAYGGIGFGGAGTINTSNYKPEDFDGTEITYKAPNGGIGFCTGIHIGITQRIVQRLAINAQVGMKYYNLGFEVDDPTYPGGTSFRYRTITIPVTLGLRYRMGWMKEYNSRKGRYQIAAEEIHKKKD